MAKSLCGAGSVNRYAASILLPESDGRALGSAQGMLSGVSTGPLFRARNVNRAGERGKHFGSLCRKAAPA